MDISQPSDWYKVTKEDVYNQGGQKLLEQYYDDSLFKVIIECRGVMSAGFESLVS